MLNYIFDLDGTLIDSSKEVLLCLEKAFSMADYPIDKSRLTQSVIGPPLKEIIQSIAPDLDDEDKILEVVKLFRKIYDNNQDDMSVVYEGVLEFLNELKASGAKLFVATFKPEIPTLRLIKTLELSGIFDDIYAIDKFGYNISKEEMILDIIDKYNLDKAETVMIGDAPTDVIAAEKAGVIGIGALWGYGEDKQPLIVAADFVVDKISKIHEVLKGVPA